MVKLAASAVDESPKLISPPTVLPLLGGVPAPVQAMKQALPAVVGEARDAPIVLHQLPDRAVPVVGGQCMQIGQRQAAPGRPQQGQPMHAVSAVMQGPEQGQQILDVLPSVQPFDVDGLETQVGCTAPDFGDQRIEMAARPDQHGNALLRRLAPCLTDQREHLSCLVAGAV